MSHAIQPFSVCCPVALCRRRPCCGGCATQMWWASRGWQSQVRATAIVYVIFSQPNTAIEQCMHSMACPPQQHRAGGGSCTACTCTAWAAQVNAPSRTPAAALHSAICCLLPPAPEERGILLMEFCAGKVGQRTACAAAGCLPSFPAQLPAEVAHSTVTVCSCMPHPSFHVAYASCPAWWMLFGWLQFSTI